jgi:integrase
MYRFNRRQRRLTLGTFSATSLADARELAREALRSVEKGHDPAVEKAAARDADTFAELAHEYLEKYAKKEKKSWEEDERVINRELLPTWRHSRARDISRRDVRALIESIADRGAPILANRTLALIRKIYNVGIERDIVESNPCHLLKRPSPERSRDRVLTDDELRRVWNSLEGQDPLIRALFRLRILTAQRGGEVRQMKWADVDLDAGWWTIPAEISKNKLAHRVPLNPQAKRILSELREYQDRRLGQINAGRKKKRQEPKQRTPWVFPSPNDFGPIRWIAKASARIKNDSGIEFRPHDLRRTAASMMTQSGTPRLVVQRILNHSEKDVTAVYDRYSYDAEKRIALESWGRRVEGIVKKKPGGKNNVVAITAGATRAK